MGEQIAIFKSIGTGELIQTQLILSLDACRDYAWYTRRLVYGNHFNNALISFFVYAIAIVPLTSSTFFQYTDMQCLL